MGDPETMYGVHNNIWTSAMTPVIIWLLNREREVGILVRESQAGGSQMISFILSLLELKLVLHLRLHQGINTSRYLHLIDKQFVEGFVSFSFSFSFAICFPCLPRTYTIKGTYFFGRSMSLPSCVAPYKKRNGSRVAR